MPAERNKANDCPHNAGLVCEPHTRNCKTCGWSPEVSEARRKARGGPIRPKQVQEPAPAEPEKKERFRNWVGAERPERSVVCTVCERTFTTRAGRASYCSKDCREKAHKERRKEAKAIDKGKAATI